MFVRLDVLSTESACTLYSVWLEESEDDAFSEVCIFEEWQQDFEDGEYENDRQTVLRVIDQISKRGAKKYYFRDEDKALALPDSQSNGCRLRLYVVRFGERSLVLLDGGVKTARTAQERDTRSAFNFAQRIGIQLDKLQADGLLNLKRDGSLSLPTDGLIFEIS